ncbi:MAG: aminopeptidase P family protein [Bacteroidaceae bacterium]
MMTPHENQAGRRVAQLRRYMEDHGISAFIFPSTDPHCGEYVPRHWETRKWISGFDGSAGTAVVTLTDAALWTDSRYFLAAEEQLAGTPFRLMRERIPGTPEITEWLAQVLPAGSRVGIDAWVNTITLRRSLAQGLAAHGLQLVAAGDPAATLWTDRPPIPDSPVEVHPLSCAGEPASHKLARLRARLGEMGAGAMLVGQLDEVAWLTNLRGCDVHCCPVAVGYVLVTPQEAVLYISPRKTDTRVQDYLRSQGISTRPYTALAADLSGLVASSILLDPDRCNSQVADCLPPGCRIVEAVSPIATFKAVKNEAEQEGFRRAMLRDGVAMARFLHWLVPAVEAGGQTELSVAARLEQLRSEQPLYRGLSFDTIAGYGPHGAIVHYEPTPESDAPLQARGLLLLDSGAQYTDGTTDITRTIALGPLTPQECADYTLVLKGHIRLAMVRFPAGSSGTQLDVLARYAMWQQGINYLHGTGHGVGSCLNVHEGPHQIRMNYMPAPLVAGMTVTNEPGIYRAGLHGVRIENTMLITPFMEGEYGEFLQLEPLTLCPIDKKPILTDMMQPDEIAYLNAYHARVYDALSPHLDEAERAWLREATSPLSKN